MATPPRPRRPAFLLFLWSIPALTLALEAYWRHTYTGLHRLFVEWEIRRTGGYNEGADGLWAFVVALVLGVILALVVRRLFGKLDDDPAPIPEALPRRGIVALIIGTMVLFSGWPLYLIYWGWTAGEESLVDVSAVEAGEDPPSRVVVLQGKSLADAAIALSKGAKGRRDVFVPLVSPDWRPGRPIAVVLKAQGLSDRELAGPLRGDAFEGMISPSRLPGPVRARFEEKGLSMGGQVLVLDFREGPKEVMDGGITSLVINLLVASVFGVGLFARNRPGAAPVAQRPRPLLVEKPLPTLVGWLIFGGFLLLMAFGLLYARFSGR